MEHIGVPTKHVTRVDKYANQEDADAKRNPETVIIDHGWFEVDGTPVTDPIRIEELEALAARPKEVE